MFQNLLRSIQKILGIRKEKSPMSEFKCKPGYDPRKLEFPERVKDKDGNTGRVQAKSNDGRDYLVFFDEYITPIWRKHPTVKAWWVRKDQLKAIE